MRTMVVALAVLGLCALAFAPSARADVYVGFGFGVPVGGCGPCGGPYAGGYYAGGYYGGGCATPYPYYRPYYYNPGPVFSIGFGFGPHMCIGQFVAKLELQCAINGILAILIGLGFAIFAGGLFKGLLERAAEREKWDKEPRERAENAGTLLASGLIAGEAIIGILFAALAFADVELLQVSANPSYLPSLVCLGLVGGVLALVPRRLVRHGA